MYTHYTHIHRESVSIFSVLRYFTFACRRGRLYATFIYSLWLFFSSKHLLGFAEKIGLFYFFHTRTAGHTKSPQKKVKRLISLINEMK